MNIIKKLFSRGSKKPFSRGTAKSFIRRSKNTKPLERVVPLRNAAVQESFNKIGQQIDNGQYDEARIALKKLYESEFGKLHMNEVIQSMSNTLFDEGYYLEDQKLSALYKSHHIGTSFNLLDERLHKAFLLRGEDHRAEAFFVVAQPKSIGEKKNSATKLLIVSSSITHEREGNIEAIETNLDILENEYKDTTFVLDLKFGLYVIEKKLRQAASLLLENRTYKPFASTLTPLIMESLRSIENRDEEEYHDIANQLLTFYRKRRYDFDTLAFDTRIDTLKYECLEELMSQIPGNDLWIHRLPYIIAPERYDDVPYIDSLNAIVDMLNNSEFKNHVDFVNFLVESISRQERKWNLLNPIEALLKIQEEHLADRPEIRMKLLLKKHDIHFIGNNVDIQCMIEKELIDYYHEKKSELDPVTRLALFPLILYNYMNRVIQKGDLKEAMNVYIQYVDEVDAKDNIVVICKIILEMMSANIYPYKFEDELKWLMKSFKELPEKKKALHNSLQILKTESTSFLQTLHNIGILSFNYLPARASTISYLENLNIMLKEIDIICNLSDSERLFILSRRIGINSLMGQIFNEMDNYTQAVVSIFTVIDICQQHPKLASNKTHYEAMYRDLTSLRFEKNLRRKGGDAILEYEEKSQGSQSVLLMMKFKEYFKRDDIEKGIETLVELSKGHYPATAYFLVKYIFEDFPLNKQSMSKYKTWMNSLRTKILDNNYISALIMILGCYISLYNPHISKFSIPPPVFILDLPEATVLGWYALAPREFSMEKERSMYADNHSVFKYYSDDDYAHCMVKLNLKKDLNKRIERLYSRDDPV